MKNNPFSEKEPNDDFFVQREQPTEEQTSPATDESGDAAAPALEAVADNALERMRQQYKVARANLLLVAVCTALNIVLYFFSDIYLLFSANLPYVVTAFGDLLATETASPVLLYAAIALSAVFLMPYVLGYFLSKKHSGWMLACLVYFALDTVVMFLVLARFGGLGSALLDAVFHAWVIYELFRGIRCGKALRDADVAAAATEETQEPRTSS